MASHGSSVRSPSYPFRSSSGGSSIRSPSCACQCTVSTSNSLEYWGCDCPIATDCAAACNFELRRAGKVVGRASALHVVLFVVQLAGRASALQGGLLVVHQLSIIHVMYRVNEAPPWENHRITSRRASQGLLQYWYSISKTLTRPCRESRGHNNESASSSSRGYHTIQDPKTSGLRKTKCIQNLKRS